MIKPDIQAIDDATYKDRNVKAELEYCGTFIRHRKKSLIRICGFMHGSLGQH